MSGISWEVEVVEPKKPRIVQVYHLGECFAYKNPRWPSWLVRGNPAHIKIAKNSWIGRYRQSLDELDKTEEEVLTRIKVSIWYVNGKPLEKHGVLYTPIRKLGRNLSYRDQNNYWYIWQDNEHLFHREEDCPILERAHTDTIYSIAYKIKESGIVVRV